MKGTPERVLATEYGVSSRVADGASGEMSGWEVSSQAWRESKAADKRANGKGSGDFFLAMKFFILNKFLVVNNSMTRSDKKTAVGQNIQRLIDKNGNW